MGGRGCVAVLALALLAGGCGGAADHGAGGTTQPPPPTAVTLRYDADGPGPAAAHVRRVSCPSGERSPLCAALSAMKPGALQPVPRDRACTMIFAGPQTAQITGRVRGRPVDARLNRHNGCETARFALALPALRAAFGDRVVTVAPGLG